MLGKKLRSIGGPRWIAPGGCVGRVRVCNNIHLDRPLGAVSGNLSMWKTAVRADSVITKPDQSLVLRDGGLM
jgi:hypothetical protein